MQVKMEVHNWITPNYITIKTPARPRQEGFSSNPTLELKDVDAEILSELCDTFRSEIFAKAGKKDPRI